MNTQPEGQNLWQALSCHASGCQPEPSRLTIVKVGHPDTMTKPDVRRRLSERQDATRSIEDQVSIAHAMWDQRIGQDHEGLKADDLEDELNLDLEFKVRTSLGHLEESSIVEEFLPPGPETLVIAEWKDDGDGEIVNGEVGDAAREGLEALAELVESSSAPAGTETAADGSGVTVRSTVATKFDIVPEKVEEFLRTTDRPVEVLNGAVEAIQDTEDVETSDGFGEIVFINMPYRYRLTERAEDLYES